MTINTNNNKLNYINLKPQANTFQKEFCCVLVDFFLLTTSKNNVTSSFKRI